MHLRNHLRQFLRDVRAQKLRLFLTVFGIVWGTAAVTLLAKRRGRWAAMSSARFGWKAA